MQMRIERFLPGSPYVQSIDREGAWLLVSFSPAGVPPGRIPGVLQSAAARYDVLAINSPDPQWYVGGIPETADQPGRFEHGLKEFIRSGGYRRVLFWGARKGAFGAVDFGLRCGAHSILVTGLESLHGLSPMFRARVPPPLAEQQRKRLEEWPELARASRARVHAFYGVESVTDLLHAWVAPRRLDANALVLARAGRDLPAVIAARAGMAALIDDVLQRDGLAGLERSLVDIDFGRIGRCTAAYVQGTERRRHRPGFRTGIVPRDETECYVAAAALVAQRRPRAALAHLGRRHGAVIRDQAWDSLTARALLNLGEAAAAEPIARRLHEADPGALDPVLMLHRALAGSGRAEEAAKLAISGYRADRCRVGLLEGHLKHLAATGRRDEAAALLETERQGEAGTARPQALNAIATRLGLSPSTRGATPPRPASGVTEGRAASQSASAGRDQTPTGADPGGGGGKVLPQPKRTRGR